MRLIAEAAIPSLQGRVYLQGEVAATSIAKLPPPRHSCHFHVYVSLHNPGAAELMEEVREKIGLSTLSTSDNLDDLPLCECMLCYLNGDTWTGGSRSDAFAIEVASAMGRGVGLLLAHEMPGLGQDVRHGVEFASFFKDGATDPALLKAGIYGKIAVPLKGDPWRQASMALLAKSLVEVEPQVATLVGSLEARRSRITSATATGALNTAATRFSDGWTAHRSTNDHSVSRADARRSHLTRGSCVEASQREPPPTARCGRSAQRQLQALMQARSIASSPFSTASQRQRPLAGLSSPASSDAPPHVCTPSGAGSPPLSAPCDIVCDHLASRSSVAAFFSQSEELGTSRASAEPASNGQCAQDTCAVVTEPCLADGAHSLRQPMCRSTSCTAEHAHLRVEPSPLPPPGQTAFPESHVSNAIQRGKPGSTRICRTAEAREGSRQLLQQRLEMHNRRVTHNNNMALTSARTNAACLSHRGHTPARHLKQPQGGVAGCDDPAVPGSPPVCSPVAAVQRSSTSPTSSCKQSIRTVSEERHTAAAPSPAAEGEVDELSASSGTTAEIPEHVQYV